MATASGIALPPRRANPGDLARRASLSPLDLLLWGLSLFGVFSEFVVFFEPAPADAILMAAFALALILGKLSFRTVSIGPAVALGVFCVANFISLLDPINMARAITYAFITIYLVLSWLFFVGLVGHYGDRFLRKLVSAYLLAGFLSALLGIVGYFHLAPHSDRFLLNGRASGLFKDCNVYGPFLVPVVLVTTGSLVRGLTRQNVYALIPLSASLVAILVCFSRACWMNTAIALAAYFTMLILGMKSAHKRKMLLTRAAVAGIVVGVVVLFASQLSSVENMMKVRVTQNGLQDYDRVRFATQELAIETVQKRPLGIGPGQSELAFNYATHSMYVRILVENGYLGLTAFLVFVGLTLRHSIVAAFRSASPLYREINLIASSCILGHLINSAVIDTVHWRHIWIVYALAWVTPLHSTPAAVPAPETSGSSGRLGSLPGGRPRSTFATYS